MNSLSRAWAWAQESAHQISPFTQPGSVLPYDSTPVEVANSVSERHEPRRKVLFVVDTLDLGGTETQTMQLARQLKANGHSVAVGCLHPGGVLAQDLIKEGIPVVEFPKPGSLLSLNGAYQMFRLACFIRRNKFDVVHAHDLWANLMAVPAARITGAPVILSSQRELGILFWYTPFRRKVIATIHRLSSQVVTNSAAAKKFLVEDFRVPSGQVQVLRNGVDFQRFALAHEDRRKIFPTLDLKARLVAVVANMHSSVKGHHDLIEAARIICRVMPQTSFVLVGDGKERPKIEEHAKRAGVREHFVFLGRRKDVPELLACCELSVLASSSEALPNSVLEAMAAGLPVVATRVGGIPEIIEDGISGLLIPPHDHQALADAVLRVMQDPALAASLAHAGQQRVRTQFTFDRLVVEIERLYYPPHPAAKDGSLYLVNPH
jgi:L-malate glycosyltransferase